MGGERRHRWANYLTRGFSPLKIAGLELWLKADAITGLDDGDPVVTWADSSGNGYDVTQGTPAARPLYRTNIQNGLPIVRTDGTDDSLSATFTNNQPATIFCAFVQRTASPGNTVIDGNAVNALRMGSNVVAGTNTGQAYSVAAGFNSLIPLTNGSAFVFGVVFNGASSVIYVNGTEVTGTVGAGNGSGIDIALSQAGTLYLAADYGEVCNYNVAINANQRATLGNYLASKWGIS